MPKKSPTKKKAPPKQTAKRTAKDSGTKKHSKIIDIIAASPKVTGTLEEPYPRKRETDWAVTVSVDRSRKRDAIKLADRFPVGQHVVAIIIPIEHAHESAPWLQMNQGEILEAAKVSDYKKKYEVSTGFMADVLNMTDRNLQLLNKKGVAVKFGRGRYDLCATASNYVRELDKEAKGRGGQEYSEERTKDKREQRLMRELDRLQKAEQLVDAGESEATGFEMGLKYRKALDNLIPRVSPQLVHAKSQAKVRAILKPEIDQILTSLALNQDPKPKRKKSAGSRRKRK